MCEKTIKNLSLRNNFQWKWSEIGEESGKTGRVYNYPLTFGPRMILMEQKRTDGLASLEEFLDVMVAEGNITVDTSILIQAISKGAKIVSAITRYPLARVRAGEDSDRYVAAAKTAFTEEIKENKGDIGLLFIKDDSEPALVYNGGNTAVSLTPMVCSDNIVNGLPAGTVFMLSDMEWDGLRPRLGGYIMYSSITVMLINIGDCVMEFTLDQEDVFRLTNDNIFIPDNEENYFNVNDINIKIENSTVKVRSEEDCLIPDIHQILKKGGVMIDTKGEHSTQFLLSPVSMLVTRAGGVATNGTIPVLDLKPKYQNETSPFYIGNTKMVENLLGSQENDELRAYFP